MLDLAINLNLIEKSGAWFNYGEMRLGQGREKAKLYLRENADLCEEIKGKILSVKGVVEEK